jgi:ubiquinol-cytochrome c reductase cytochrome b subunit
VPVQEEKPRLAEPEVSPESNKLPEGDAAPKAKPELKELSPEIPSKTQADLGVGADNNPNVGSGDLNKP